MDHSSRCGLPICFRGGQEGNWEWILPRKQSRILSSSSKLQSIFVVGVGNQKGQTWARQQGCNLLSLKEVLTLL